LERGLPGIYAILEKESATGIIGAIAVAVVLLEWVLFSSSRATSRKTKHGGTAGKKGYFL